MVWYLYLENENNICFEYYWHASSSSSVLSDTAASLRVEIRSLCFSGNRLPHPWMENFLSQRLSLITTLCATTSRSACSVRVEVQPPRGLVTSSWDLISCSWGTVQQHQTWFIASQWSPCPEKGVWGHNPIKRVLYSKRRIGYCDVTGVFVCFKRKCVSLLSAQKFNLCCLSSPV